MAPRKEHSAKERQKKRTQGIKRWGKGIAAAAFTLYGANYAHHNYIDAADSYVEAVAGGDFRGFNGAASLADRIISAEKIADIYKTAFMEGDYYMFSFLYNADKEEDTFLGFDADLQDFRGNLPLRVFEDNREGLIAMALKNEQYRMLFDVAAHTDVMNYHDFYVQILSEYGADVASQDDNMRYHFSTDDLEVVLKLSRGYIPDGVMFDFISENLDNILYESSSGSGMFGVYDNNTPDHLKQRTQRLVMILTENGYTDVAQRFVEAEGISDQVRGVYLSKFAEIANGEDLIEAAMDIGIRRNAQLMDIAIRAFMAENNDAAEEFANHFDLSKPSVYSSLFDRALDAEQSAPAIYAVVNYYDNVQVEDIDAAATRMLVWAVRENGASDRKLDIIYESARAVGVKFENAESRNALSAIFSGTYDDALREYFADYDAAAQINDDGAVITRPATALQLKR